MVARIIVYGLTIGSIYALLGLGLNLLWGTMRILNIAHGGLIMFGAFSAYWLFTLYAVNTFVSAIIAAIGGAVFGILIYKILFAKNLRTVKSLEAIEIHSYLIFFGVLIILENVAALLWSTNPRGYSYLTHSINILGTPLPLNRLFSSLVAIGICIAFYIYLQKSLFGKAVRAVIQDKDATQLVGVNVNKVYMFCFCAGFGTAGLTGALISMFYSITPYMGLSYAMAAFVVVILGGLGKLLGSLIGGLLLGIVMTAGVAVTTPGAQLIILYLIFILVIVFLPAGILGKRLR